MLWKSYVEFDYAMAFLRKNAILVEKIGVDDQEGISKAVIKHLILLFVGLAMIDFCLVVHCLKREFLNY